MTATIMMVLVLCLLFESSLPMAVLAVLLALGVAEDLQNHEAVCAQMKGVE